MKIDVYNRSGEVVDKTNMRDDVFKVPLNQPLLHQALVMYQANQRQGTHSTKTRAERNWTRSSREYPFSAVENRRDSLRS